MPISNRDGDDGSILQLWLNIRSRLGRRGIFADKNQRARPSRIRDKVSEVPCDLNGALSTVLKVNVRYGTYMGNLHDVRGNSKVILESLVPTNSIRIAEVRELSSLSQSRVHSVLIRHSHNPRHCSLYFLVR